MDKYQKLGTERFNILWFVPVQELYRIRGEIKVEEGHLPKNDKSVMSQFPEEVVKKAFSRANCRCQCERENHDHGSFTCYKQVIWENRGNKTERNGWEATYFVSPEKCGKLTVENCEILCMSCFEKVQSQ